MEWIGTCFSVLVSARTILFTHSLFLVADFTLFSSSFMKGHFSWQKDEVAGSQGESTSDILD